ncbi:putative coil containing protein [Vibrio phage 409E50-1]|nr:putative coil containing protein [Vibrio phage 521E56-1]CAH9012549.1 putative coil containing protein [Vibrio phage 384E50-1]CAH9012586.1 putative coil containing protein [Vibrio phage 409E50-1]CAH9012598.1 putative coil containing protein [Vibrio phage 402E50-1]CAH9013536.1 putative coil containing protein [Vibrio phage 405E50-1]CAH9013599.1 putative coil containing protein [Vibrio phage 413E50-1]
MAMTVKKGDVVKLNERHWSYQGKHTAGHIGVVTAIHGTLDPRGGHQWVNVDDEEGAPFWIPVTTMSMVANSNDGVLLEDLILEDGDVLVATDENEWAAITAGNTYPISYRDRGCGCCHVFMFKDDDGDWMEAADDDFYFINLSALKREYQSDAVPTAEVFEFPTPIFLDEGVERIAPLNPKYEDMDIAAKGAILLAAHEGKMIQYMSPSGGFWVDDMSFDPSENFAYRVKPQELIDAEEALNAAASNVVSMREAVDAADREHTMASAALAASELDYASVKDTVEALKAA